MRYLLEILIWGSALALVGGALGVFSTSLTKSRRQYRGRD